jgi:Subtilase family
MPEVTPERTILVPATAKILEHPSTETLHVYANGDILVRTSAPVTAVEIQLETPVSAGVCLPEENTEKRSESSGHGLDGLADREVINAYIELIGPVDRTWLETLNQLAIDLLQFRPEHSFLSRGTVKAFRQALKQSFVVDVLPMNAEIKPQPIAPESGEQEVWVVVQSPIALAASIIQELVALPEVAIDPHQEIDYVGFYLRLRATVSAAGQEALLHHPKVLAVEPYSPVQPDDEVAGLILAGQYDHTGRPQGSYLRWLEDHGLNGEGVTIGIVDAGVDVNHPSFTGRIRDLNPERRSWHGTFVAGHAAGCYLQEKDGNQFIYGLGMAPKADLLIQDNQSTPTALCRETVTEKGLSGQSGTVQNNSWGAGTKNPMDYGSQEASYDRLVRNADPDNPVAKPLTICFSAGNSGANGLTRPKAAKNIIVTGNSENYRLEIGKNQSDNISEVYTGPRGSSHGNCGDGRIVPHLVAPGEWTASASYDSHKGDKEYISPKLTWGSGTSAASPKTAGACALLIQWWRQHNHNQDPSSALLKAMLVNGAEPMPNAGFIPNKLQGWGRLNLENVLRQDIRRIYVDQTRQLKQRGEQQTWQVRAVNPSLPVKITLCWTDPPGALGTGTNTAAAIVNKLALRVEHNGQLYRGNQFQNGWSYSNGSSDREGWDNLQNVFLAPGIATGTLQISVTALEITTNCLTGKIDIPQQDFALVITNGVVENGTSAVFVGIDPNAQTSPPPPPAGGYWAGANHDGQDLNHNWWQSIDNASHNQPPPVKPSPKPPTQQQVDAWWLQDDIVWSKPESDREQTIDPTIVQSLQAGITVVTAGKTNQIVIAGKATAESSRDRDQSLIIINQNRDDSGSVNPETSRDITHLLESTAALSESLAQLMQNWTQFGSLANTDRVAVLLVGAGTRVTPADISAFRRLTLLGQLYLVSEDARLLSFLVQRIYRRSNLICRLAKDANALPTLLRDTIVEASGGQQLAIAKTSQIFDSKFSNDCTFAVTSCDRHLTIRLQFPPGFAPEVELYRPGKEPIALNTGNTIADIQMIAGEDFCQFDCAIVSAGGWKLRLRQPGLEDVCRVRVWAWSDLGINVTPKILPINDPTQSELIILMTVNGSEGITFKRIQGQPRSMYETADSAAIQAESDRPIAVSATEPRSGQWQPTNESSRVIQAAELGTVLRIAKPTQGAIAIDLPLWVEGTDPKGNPFTRLIRHSLIDLEPRSQWRQRIEPSITPLLTLAKIIAVEREAGEIARLRLQQGDRVRSVFVTSALLRSQLEWLLQQSWSAQEWLVGVIGSELYGLYRSLLSCRSL